MIELTPLDVRQKRGDFRRAMRGFDPTEVDSFLELVAERMESLVKENLTLKERAARLQDQVREQGDREKAVQDALVTAQELRKDISGQAQREAELIKREAESEIERMLLDAEHRAEELRSSAVELERRRRRFLRTYRQHLERELEEVDREAGLDPLDEPPLELDLDAIAPGTAESLSAVGTPEGPPETLAADDEVASPSAEETIGESVPDWVQESDDGPALVQSEGQPEIDGTVAVESLAPEHDGGGEEATNLDWPSTARMPTEVSSDPAGDPDGL